MERKPNIVRLKRALEIMTGLKEDQVDLGMIMENLDGPHGSCGSCGCIIGWCSTDQKAFPGLHFDASPRAPSKPLQWDGVNYPSYDYDGVGADVFGVSLRDASDLFCARGEGRFDKDLFPTKFGDPDLDEPCLTDESPVDRDVAIARLRFAIDVFKTGATKLPARIDA